MSSNDANNVNSNGAKFRVALIGTGRPHSDPDHTGWGMSHLHATGYNETGRCEIVALCDAVPERAEDFNARHADGNAQIFTDYEKMLADVRPDIVSICTWPALHAPMTIACAEAGVRAIHCEKPMAPTWGEAGRMAEACRERNVQLSFNHQRRFLDVFQRARQLVQDGAIGELTRVEGATDNMMDWGTHWFNMFLFYNNESPASWVMGQVDARKPRFVYGVPMETYGVSLIGFENGVTGALYTGDGAVKQLGCANRLTGTDGYIEVSDKAPHLRIRGKNDPALRAIKDAQGGIHGDHAVSLTIADVVDSLATGRAPLTSVTNALATTEIIFATYESARRRVRVDLPLTIEGSPLAALLAENAFPHAGNGVAANTTGVTRNGGFA